MSATADIKKDILWRVYISFLVLVLFAVAILAKGIMIQTTEGKYWRSMADSAYTKTINLEAERGNIYSADGRLLSTTIPFFEIRLDFRADGIKKELWEQQVDSLSVLCAQLFKDQSKAAYKQILQNGRSKNSRYFLFKKNVPFSQYLAMRQFPIWRMGKNRGGFVAISHNKRLLPYGLLANRTIGLSRDTFKHSVGLEKTYNDYLQGEEGHRVIRKIAGDTWVPVNENEDIEAANGNDIITTIDVHIQDVAESALMKMLQSNNSVYGTCMVMEVKTGKIKAIANLGDEDNNGTYFEDLNYGIGRCTEPGSTFKLATMISLLEDNYVNIKDTINILGGRCRYGNRTMYDSERHGRRLVTVKQAFALSSNVGMSQMIYKYYSRKPQDYLNHLHKLKLDTLTGVDLYGEAKPFIKNTKHPKWSATSLPWMSIGYELQVSPLQTLAMYNAVANNGVMVKPYLVQEIQAYGKTIKKIEPQIVNAKICSDSTLVQLKEILESVVNEGTATNLKNKVYGIAGKTGTSLVAEGPLGYDAHIYQSSFCGYFPADNPVYSCIVVIKNKPLPQSLKYYGSLVAAPVFKEVSDRLFATIKETNLVVVDSVKHKVFSKINAVSQLGIIKNLCIKLSIPFSDSTVFDGWCKTASDSNSAILFSQKTAADLMPNLKGMGLKDAINMCENMGLEVAFKGVGKVVAQSIESGNKIKKGNKLLIVLG